MPHSGQESYSCTICRKKFSRFGLLAVHLKKHNMAKTSKKSKSLSYKKKCTAPAAIRKKSFSSIKKKPHTSYSSSKAVVPLESHTFMGGESTIKLYNCSLCSSGYTRRYNLASHLRRRHPHVKTGAIFPNPAGRLYRCGYCRKAYERRDRLNLHLKQEHLKTEVQTSNDGHISGSGMVNVEKATNKIGSSGRISTRSSPSGSRQSVRQNSAKISQCRQCDVTSPSEKAQQENSAKSPSGRLCDVTSPSEKTQQQNSAKSPSSRLCDVTSPSEKTQQQNSAKSPSGRLCDVTSPEKTQQQNSAKSPSGRLCDVTSPLEKTQQQPSVDSPHVDMNHMNNNLHYALLRPYKCDFCEKRYTRKENLKKHFKYHFPSSSNGKPRMIMGRQPLKSNQESVAGLKCTKTVEPGVSEGTESCVQAKVILGKNGPNMQNVCAEGPSSSMMKFKDKKKRPQCPICSKFFSQSAHVKRHLPIHDRKGKIVQNSNANVPSFSAKQELASAKIEPSSAKMEPSSAKTQPPSAKTESKETKVLYQCLVCNNTFGQRYQLLKHMKLHEEDDKSRQNLLAKVRPVSTKTKPKGTLPAKTKPKGNQKVHQCDVCKKTFSQAFHVKRHLKKVHGEDRTSSQNLQAGHSSSNVEHDGKGTQNFQTGIRALSNMEYDGTNTQNFKVACVSSDMEHNGTSTENLAHHSLNFEQNGTIAQNIYMGVHSSSNMEHGGTSTQNLQEGVPPSTNMEHYGTNTRNLHPTRMEPDYLIENSYAGVSLTCDKEHKNGKEHQCPVCGLIVGRRQDLKRHLKTHFEGKAYICQECGDGFANEVNLKQHFMAKHVVPESTEEDSDNHTCPFCSKTFQQSWHLKLHMNEHSVKKCYSCSICSAKFGSASNMHRHYQIIHSEKQESCPPSTTAEDPYVCSVCGHIFPNLLNLKQHCASKHVTQQNSEEVEEYQTVAELEKTECDAEKLYRCDKCDKNFSLYAHFKKHLQSFKHTGMRPYGCGICAAKFTNSYNRNRHVRQKHLTKEINENGVVVELKKEPEVNNYTEEGYIDVKALEGQSYDTEQATSGWSTAGGQQDGLVVDYRVQDSQDPAMADQTREIGYHLSNSVRHVVEENEDNDAAFSDMDDPVDIVEYDNNNNIKIPFSQGRPEINNMIRLSQGRSDINNNMMRMPEDRSDLNNNDLNMILSYGRTDLMSRGRTDLMSQGRADLMSRGRIDLMSKGRADLMSQGRIDPVSKGRADLMFQGRIDPMYQGRADLMAVGRTDCVSQYRADLMSEGRADLISQGRTDCVSQYRADLMSEGRADLISQGRTDLMSLGRGNLMSQGRTDQNNNDVPQQCLFCYKTFHSVGDMKHHLKVHIHRPEFSCPVCNERFSSQFALEQHKLEHIDVQEYRKCMYCSKVFTMEGDMLYHRKIHLRGRFELTYSHT